MLPVGRWGTDYESLWYLSLLSFIIQVSLLSQVHPSSITHNLQHLLCVSTSELLVKSHVCFCQSFSFPSHKGGMSQIGASPLAWMLNRAIIGPQNVKCHQDINHWYLADRRGLIYCCSKISNRSLIHVTQTKVYLVSSRTRPALEETKTQVTDLFGSLVLISTWDTRH